MDLSLLREISYSQPPVLIGDSSFSTAFTIAGLDIQWYAIFSIAGYLIAICIFMFSIWKRYKVNIDVGFYYIFVAIPVILLGARTWSFVIGDASGNFFDFREGGLAIEGGVLFGVIAALIYFPIILHFPKYHSRVVIDGKVYIQKPSMWIYADAIVPTILIGQAIGRWGNFFNGEIYGAEVSPESLAWLKNLMPGVYEHMQAQQTVTILGTGQVVIEQGAFYQPLFLYESFMNVIAFVIIYGLLAEIKQIRIGVITGLYCVSYGIIRFIMEPMRNQAFEFFGTYITTGFLLAIGILIVIYCQFIGYKYRDYKWYLLFKETLSYKLHKSSEKVCLKDYKKPQFIRVDSDKTFYAYR